MDYVYTPPFTVTITWVEFKTGSFIKKALKTGRVRYNCNRYIGETCAFPVAGVPVDPAHIFSTLYKVGARHKLTKSPQEH